MINLLRSSDGKVVYYVSRSVASGKEEWTASVMQPGTNVVAHGSTRPRAIRRLAKQLGIPANDLELVGENTSEARQAVTMPIRALPRRTGKTGKVDKPTA